MVKFDNRFLKPIQGFTQSKIEKAKLSYEFTVFEKSEKYSVKIYSFIDNLHTHASTHARTHAHTHTHTHF